MIFDPEDAEKHRAIVSALGLRLHIFLDVWVQTWKQLSVNK